MAEGLLDGVLGGEEEKIEPTEGGTERSFPDSRNGWAGVFPTSIRSS